MNAFVEVSFIRPARLYIPSGSREKMVITKKSQKFRSLLTFSDKGGSDLFSLLCSFCSSLVLFKNISRLVIFLISSFSARSSPNLRRYSVSLGVSDANRISSGPRNVVQSLRAVVEVGISSI